MSSKVNTITQPDMQHNYYGISGTHAERAYQPRQGDKVPPISAVPSTSPNGEFVALMTTIYNRAPFGIAQMELVDFNSLVRFNGGSVPSDAQADQIIKAHPEIICVRIGGQTPFIAKIMCAANDPLTLRPLTGGYMSMVMSKDDYNRGGGRPKV
jgi:hypothetical protein